MGLSKGVQSERNKEDQPGWWEIRRVLERAERGWENSGRGLRDEDSVTSLDIHSPK